jgi:hypothetical protein
MARMSAATQYGPYRGSRAGLAQSPVRLRLVGPDRKCVLRCYPHDDPEFEADAQRAVGDCQKPNQTWEQLLEDVRSRMRLAYPAVTIRPRDPIAAGDDPDELWYCFRDGGIFPA